MSGAVTWTERSVAPGLPTASRIAFETERALVALDAGGEEVAIYVARSAMDAVLRHGRASSLEQGGILLGHAYRLDGEPPGGPSFLVDVKVALPAGEATSSPVSFRFGRETWTGLHRAWRTTGADLELVGWFHTHPNLGAFFSGTDRATQRDFFSSPWQLGLVVDPVRSEEAWFAGVRSLPIRARALYETSRATQVAPPRAAALGIVRRIGRDGRLFLAGRSAPLRIAGIALPPGNARVKPVRRLAAQARRVLARYAVGRPCFAAMADGAAVAIPPTPSLLVDGAPLAEPLLRRGLARLVADQAGPLGQRLRAAEDLARRRGLGIWTRRTLEWSESVPRRSGA